MRAELSLPEMRGDNNNNNNNNNNGHFYVCAPFLRSRAQSAVQKAAEKKDTFIIRLDNDITVLPLCVVALLVKDKSQH